MRSAAKTAANHKTSALANPKTTGYIIATIQSESAREPSSNKKKGRRGRFVPCSALQAVPFRMQEAAEGDSSSEALLRALHLALTRDKKRKRGVTGKRKGR